MNKNLSWKLVVIVGILLVFLAGIFGIPKDWSGKGILASITDRIHLGLDLRGGTHLILQVQVNDAVNVDSDNAIARLKEDMRARKINYADITKPDPVNHPEMIVVKGIPPEQSSDFKSIVSDRLPDYNTSSGAENSWTVSMKAQNLADLKNRAVTQAIETIRNRIDQLGVSEPVIQEHGLGECVRLLGHVGREQLEALYERADVVVLTSRSEGIPLVLMEAMALGKIVLAPAITGIPELITTGQTGFLYDSGSVRDFVAHVSLIHWFRQQEFQRPDPSCPTHSAATYLESIGIRARAQICRNFNLGKNLEAFAELFVERITARAEKTPNENFVLQQI